MHIPSASNSLSALQAASAAARTTTASGEKGGLFSANLAGGQDLQGSGLAPSSLSSSPGGLIAPSSLLLAQQMDSDYDGSDPLASLLDPSGTSAGKSAYNRPALS